MSFVSPLLFHYSCWMKTTEDKNCRRGEKQKYTALFPHLKVKNCHLNFWIITEFFTTQIYFEQPMLGVWSKSFTANLSNNTYWKIFTERYVRITYYHFSTAVAEANFKKTWEYKDEERQSSFFQMNSSLTKKGSLFQQMIFQNSRFYEQNWLK